MQDWLHSQLVELQHEYASNKASTDQSIAQLIEDVKNLKCCTTENSEQIKKLIVHVDKLENQMRRLSIIVRGFNPAKEADVHKCFALLMKDGWKMSPEIQAKQVRKIDTIHWLRSNRQDRTPFIVRYSTMNAKRYAMSLNRGISTSWNPHGQGIGVDHDASPMARQEKSAAYKKFLELKAAGKNPTLRGLFIEIDGKRGHYTLYA